MGLAGVKTSWQRQTKYFGHDRGDQYSVLLIDNRGMGESDKPFARYSTTEMAKDVVEVLEDVAWTSPRQLNLVGISMGGMIAQEFACMFPKRIQSLSLLCTSAKVENAKGLMATVTERMGFLVPKSTERSIHDTALQLFTPEWLAAPDAEMLPDLAVTPRCGPPPKEVGPEYRLFDSNFQRFQAQELSKRLDPNLFTTKGVLCQLTAAGWHRKTDEQLRQMADQVGRERIMVMHGKRDKMITCPNGEKLVKVIQPGVFFIEEGMGHAPVMERTKWFNSVLEERLGAWTKIQDES